MDSATFGRKSYVELFFWGYTSLDSVRFGAKLSELLYSCVCVRDTSLGISTLVVFLLVHFRLVALISCRAWQVCRCHPNIHRLPDLFNT